MQILPFIFSIILAIFLVTSKMSQDESVNQKLFLAIKERTTDRLNLLKKGERAHFYRARALAMRQAGFNQDKIKTVYLPRPVKSQSSEQKISLSFLKGPIDELTLQFAKKEIFLVLKTIYQDKIDEFFFDQLLKTIQLNQFKCIEQVQFSQESLQKQLFELLTDASCPFDDIVTLDLFDKQALFHFHFLRRDLFEIFFSHLNLETYFHEEKLIRKSMKKKEISKEKIWPIFFKFEPHWQTVSIERLISFKKLEKNLFKAISENRTEYFYFPKAEEVSPQI